jgi:hypothetical protein
VNFHNWLGPPGLLSFEQSVLHRNKARQRDGAGGKTNTILLHEPPANVGALFGVLFE